MNKNSANVVNKFFDLSKNSMNNDSYSRSNSYSNKKVSTYSYLYYLLVILLLIAIILFLIFYTKYVYSDNYHMMSFKEYLFGLNKSEPIEEKVEVSNGVCPAILNEIIKPEPKKKCDSDKENEVYHIGNQAYTYNQARCKCASYGGKLATYDQIVDAYNKGADWCSYGWSENQKAYYPTQKATYDKLQSGPENQRNNCGKTGVNGGVFLDDTIRFGINCFGPRPEGKITKLKSDVEINDEEEDNKPKFCSLEQNYEANRKLTTDVIKPFNNNQWSQYE